MPSFEIDGLRDLLAGFALERGTPIPGARVRMARNEVGELVTCRWSFEDGRAGEPRVFDYRQFRIEDRWVEMPRALDDLVALASTEKIATASWERRVAHHQKYTDWPEWYVELRPKDYSNAGLKRLDYKPAVGFDLPPFDSGGNAISDLIWPEVSWSGGAPAHSVEIVVTLPDTRGRIRSVSWERRTLLVELDGECLSSCELQVVPLADTKRGPITRRNPVQTEARIEVPDDTSRVEIFLVHSSGELLHKRTTNAGSDLSEPADRLSAEQRADLDRMNGENDTVEFKPFIDRGNAKEAELVETAVAFANTAGGTIYLGIRDKAGALEGSRALHAVAKGLEQARLDDYRAGVETYLRDTIRPGPAVTSRYVQIRGEPVLAIRIDKGTSPPYATHDHDVFVRKGSTNRKPDPHTELRQLFGTGGDGLPGGYLSSSLFE